MPMGSFCLDLALPTLLGIQSTPQTRLCFFFGLHLSVCLFVLVPSASGSGVRHAPHPIVMDRAVLRFGICASGSLTQLDPTFEFLFGSPQSSTRCPFALVTAFSFVFVCFNPPKEKTKTNTHIHHQGVEAPTAFFRVRVRVSFFCLDDTLCVWCVCLCAAVEHTG